MSELIVYPCSDTKTSSVIIQGLTSGKYDLSMYGINGQLILPINSVNLEGNQQLEVRIPAQIAPGICFIKATSANDSKTFKISIL